MPDLLAIFRVGVDIRNIDVDAASQDGILVTRATPGFVNSVAELAIGMMIDLGRHVSYAVGSYRAGQAPTPRLGRQLYGATLGIIGYGAVGQRLAGLAQTLAMSVLVNDPFASNFAAGLQLSAIRLRGSGLLWLRLARWRRSLCPWLPLRVICAAR